MTIDLPAASGSNPAAKGAWQYGSNSDCRDDPFFADVLACTLGLENMT